MSGLRFSLLGPVRAWLDDDEIDLGSHRQRALLAVLLLRPDEPVTVAEAAWALCGDEAPPSAYETVRTDVHRLRRTLAGLGHPGVELRSHSSGYRLSVGDATVDVHRFRRRLSDAQDARERGDHARSVADLVAALALWRGTPVTGCCSAFFDGERTRLERLYLLATEDLARAHIDAGEHAGAALILRAALAAHPRCEPLWELLLLVAPTPEPVPAREPQSPSQRAASSVRERSPSLR